MFNLKISKKIVSMFNQETKNARKIAKELNIPRRYVMAFLQVKGMRSYSEGSYS